MSTTYVELLQEFVPRPISSEQAYREALKNVEQLMRKPAKTRAEDDMLELFATLVEQYEIRKGYATPVISARDRLKGLMEAHQLTQTELSRRSNVPRSTINEVLSGKRNISKANAARLARFFGVSIEEFIL